MTTKTSATTCTAPGDSSRSAGRRGWGGWAGWGGPGGPGDPRRGGGWGGFGDEFRIGRMLASGDLRLIALYFIEQQPRHGYDLIKAIEEKTCGRLRAEPRRHLPRADVP